MLIRELTGRGRRFGSTNRAFAILRAGYISAEPFVANESPAKLRTFLFRKHHCRNHELIEWRILAIRQSIPAIRDRAVIEAKSAAVKVIVQLIRILLEGIADLDERIEEAAAAYDESKYLAALTTRDSPLVAVIATAKSL